MTATEVPPALLPRQPVGVGRDHHGELPAGRGALHSRRLALRPLFAGRAEDPAWVRPMLLLLLAFTLFVYTVDLASAGYANDFYTAAVQAATKSWKALFFGSSDAHNVIMVDKPPAALWVMDLSARLFGFSPWSVLLPQAAEGVASVTLLYAGVRRVWTPQAGLLAGGLLAITPVAAELFRFNDPDALLALLLIAATYATIRAVENGHTRWLVAAGGLIGLAFMTKMLQAFLVVPGLGLTYLVAGPPHVRRRLLQLAAAGMALAISAGWWVVTVELVPAGDRPYVGGSPHNSVLDLIFGYNGLGRLSGSESGSVGFVSAASSGAGSPGPLRMFDSAFASSIAWFLPLAIAGLVVGLWTTRRRIRTDLQRAALLAWGGTLIVTGAAFSLGHGIIHPYYSLALAPSAAALAASGLASAWQRRSDLRWRRALVGLVAVCLATTDIVLSSESGWGLGHHVAVGLVIGMLIVAMLQAPRLRPMSGRIVCWFVAAACLLGPISASAFRVMNPPDLLGGAAGSLSEASLDGPTWLLRPVAVPPAVRTFLSSGSAGYQWVAAAVGSNRAASYQLATGSPVIAVGGFNGTDPAPTLPEFERMVETHEVRYFVAGRPGQWTGGPEASAIGSWVGQHFTSFCVNGTRVYDLSDARRGGLDHACP